MKLVKKRVEMIKGLYISVSVFETFMKSILYITLVMLLLLPCTRAFAGEAVLSMPDALKYSANEEFRADWESEENARIMGESVVSSFRNGDAPGIKLNALCSAASMAEISRIRGWFKSLIESEKRAGIVTDQSLLADVRPGL